MFEKITTAVTGISPGAWKAIFFVILLLVVFSAGAIWQYRSVTADWKAADEIAKNKTLELKSDQGDLTVQSVEHHVKADKKIVETGTKILSEVHNYVPSNSPCGMPDGYRVFHDAAADNIILESPGNLYGSGTGVGTSTSR
jgi:hypothetical protein